MDCFMSSKTIIVTIFYKTSSREPVKAADQAPIGVILHAYTHVLAASAETVPLRSSNNMYRCKLRAGDIEDLDAEGYLVQRDDDEEEPDADAVAQAAADQQNELVTYNRQSQRTALQGIASSIGTLRQESFDNAPPIGAVELQLPSHARPMGIIAVEVRQVGKDPIRIPVFRVLTTQAGLTLFTAESLHRSSSRHMRALRYREVEAKRKIYTMQPVFQDLYPLIRMHEVVYGTPSGLPPGAEENPAFATLRADNDQVVEEDEETGGQPGQLSFRSALVLGARRAAGGNKLRIREAAQDLLAAQPAGPWNALREFDGAFRTMKQALANRHRMHRNAVEADGEDDADDINNALAQENEFGPAEQTGPISGFADQQEQSLPFSPGVGSVRNADLSFGRMFIQGMCSDHIALVEGNRLPKAVERFREHVTEAMLEGMNFDEALEHRRLFMVDLEHLHGIPGVQDAAGERFIVGCSCLFFLRVKPNERWRESPSGSGSVTKRVPDDVTGSRTLVAMREQQLVPLAIYLMHHGVEAKAPEGLSQADRAYVGFMSRNMHSSRMVSTSDLGENLAEEPPAPAEPQVPGIVITNADNPNAWFVAKAFVRCAALNETLVMGMAVRGNLSMGIVAGALQRTLPSSHPVNRLLKRHVRGTAEVNMVQLPGITGSEGQFHHSLSVGGLQDEGGKEMLKRMSPGYMDVRLWVLPTDLEGRGLADKNVLPDYPHRDHGLMLWQSFRDYFESTLEVMYPSDEAVARDPELRRFTEELVEFGIEALPPVHTIGDLATLLTALVWNATGNFCMNYARLFEMGVVSSSPLIMRRPPPQTVNEITTEADVLAYLPNRNDTYAQSRLVYELLRPRGIGTGDDKRYVLGSGRHYKDEVLVNHLLRRKFQLFQLSLHVAQDEFHRQNLRRLRHFLTLHPSRMPQSICS